MNVLYLHGFASGPDGTKAAALRRHLQTRGIELTAPDLNEPAFSTLTVSRSIARVEEITRAAAPWDLVGSSLGGLTAAFFAARFPQRVRRVVLLCPAFDLEKLFAASLGETEMARWRETGHYPFADASGERYRALGEYKSFKESLGNVVVISYDPASPAASARGVDPLEGLTPLAMFGIGGFAVLYSLWGALKQLNRRKSA